MRSAQSQTGLSLFPTIATPPPVPPPPAAAGPFVPVDLSAPIKRIFTQELSIPPLQRNLPLTNVVIPPPPTGIVLSPGNFWRLSTAPGLESFATISSYIDTAANTDINKKCKGIALHVQWSDLENSNAGAPANIDDSSASRYDGAWDASGERGFAKIHKIVNKAASRGYPVVLLWNLTGNGISGTTSGYDSSFSPGYMNSPTYSGGQWTSANAPSSGLLGRRVIIQDNNIQRRMIAMMKAYYTEFGAATLTGGIIMVDLCNEITASAGTLNDSLFVTNCTNTLLPGLRAAAPKLNMTLRPTFMTTQTQYPALMSAMRANKIACGNEDLSNNIGGTNHHMSWIDQAYLGMIGGGVNHATVKDWWYCGNVEMAELSKSDGNTPLPPANSGSGYLYGTSLTGAAGGIHDGIVNMNANNVIWLVHAFAGPSVNRGIGGNVGAPPNPSPGPGAGLTSARPNIMDALSDNTSFAGVVSGALDCPGNFRPPGW